MKDKGVYKRYTPVPTPHNRRRQTEPWTTGVGAGF